MAASTASLAIAKPKPFLITNQSKKPLPRKPISLPLIPHQSTTITPELSASIAKHAAMAATVISTTLSSPPIAMAAKKIADSPQQDIRGLAFLIPVIPAVGWALINILGPALNQIERMRMQRFVIFGLGLGGLAATTAMSSAPTATAASEAVEEIVNYGGNNQLYLALFVAAAAALEVILLSTKLKEYESEEKKVAE